MLDVAALLFALGQSPGQPPMLGEAHHSAPWIQTRDVAVLIERIPLEDLSVRRTVGMLVDLYQGSWQNLSAEYMLAEQGRRKHISDETRAAIATWRTAHLKARDASAQAADLYSQWRHAPTEERADFWAEARIAAERAAQLRAQIPSPPRRTDTAPHDSELTRAWFEDASKMTQRLKDDITLLLIPEQTPAFEKTWAALERARRLREGTLSGESLDLDQMAMMMQPSLTLAESSRIEPALEHWRRGVDPHLARRTTGDLEDAGQIQTALVRYDEPEALRLMTERLARARAVRDANLDGAERVADALGGARGREWLDMARLRAFNLCMRPTAAQRMLSRAADLDSIGLGQRTRIATLSEHHEQAMAPIRERMIAAWTAIDGTDNLRFVLERMGRDDPSSQNRQAWVDAQDALADEHQRVETALVRLLNQGQMRTVRRGIAPPIKSSQDDGEP